MSFKCKNCGNKLFRIFDLDNKLEVKCHKCGSLCFGVNKKEGEKL